MERPTGGSERRKRDLNGIQSEPLEMSLEKKSALYSKAAHSALFRI